MPAAERGLLACALGLVAGCRVGLWLVPFQWMRRLVESAPTGRRSGQWRPEEAALAVQRASRVIPCATCLVQALALRVLLARMGHRARIHIGVSLTQERKFEAHAWIEAGERILIGGADAGERYHRFAVWEGKRVSVDGHSN